MDRTENIINAIKQQGILPLFFHPDPEICREVVRSLYKAGVRIIEFTNRGEAALSNFKELISLRNEEIKDLLFAVGTIRKADQATKFIEAGADFLISPVFDADVCDTAYLHKILWIPGCMTPTEVHVAEHAGCKLVKLFPGNVLGPGFVGAIKELFPDMLFMPTGGVEISRENMGEWYKAGVCAVGLGSKLISSTVLKNKDYSFIENETRKAFELVKELRGQ